MKILITGADGYIGKHLCPLLASKSHYVVGMDKNIGGTGCHEWIQQDILENKMIDGEYDVVVHLAALVRVGHSVKYPMQYYQTNVVGTLNVLCNATFKHFIFASTGAAENPTSPYALSKAVVEPLIRQYCTLSQKQHTIFRFYNILGTAGYPLTNPDGLMYNLIKAKETGEFDVYGINYNTPDGTAVRDYVHVVDLCHAINSCIESADLREGPFPDVENIGTGEGHTVAEIVNAFMEANDCNFVINAKPRRPGDAEKTVLNNPSVYFKNTYTLKEMLKI